MALKESSGTGSSLTGRRSVCRTCMHCTARIASGSAPVARGSVSRASRSGSLGSGIRRTSVAHPSAANASRAWCSAAPQLRVTNSPSGSVAANLLSRTIRSSSASGSTRQRHGWLLCTDGA